ncbi:MAG: BrnT family toxin [Mesorhizobium sp.]|nr:BrnT family toxin [Mesorhizobium sp.]
MTVQYFVYTLQAHDVLSFPWRWRLHVRAVWSEQLTQFEWDSNKARQNVDKHGITFDDAAVALRQPRLEYDSPRSDEHRILAVCPHSNRIISVVYTMRGEMCRIISARPARDYEQREYRILLDRGNS